MSDCPCDFCNAKRYTIPEYLNHIDDVTLEVNGND